MPVWTEETGFEEARRRIAVCRETRVGTLDLRGLALARVPEELRELSWLRQLYLGGPAEGRANVPHAAYHSHWALANALRTLTDGLLPALRIYLRQLSGADRRLRCFRPRSRPTADITKPLASCWTSQSVRHTSASNQTGTTAPTAVHDGACIRVCPEHFEKLRGGLSSLFNWWSRGESIPPPTRG